MEKTMIKYVLQREDGQFYWKNKSVSSSYGFTEDFDKAYLFDSEKGAKTRLYLAGEGGKIRPVIIGLPEEMEPVYIPSVWTEDTTRKSPSSCAWASTDGEYGEAYYDEDMNEITKEEYEELIKKTQG